MTSTQSNLAWTVPAHASSITDLERLSRPIPTPGDHQVLVRLTAASLNYRDLLIAIRSPQYPGDHKPNLVPCCDGAGIIHTAGVSSKWASREGTKVILHPSEWLSGDVRNLDLGKVDGAAGSDELRPWKDGKRLEGKTILTQGTGGVSCFAIQIAAALGATVIATSSSDAKLALAKEFGATHGINYVTHPDWDQEVLRLTDGKGADHVIELGGSQTLMKSINSVRKGGLVSVIGILSAIQDIPGDIVPSLLFGGKIVKGCVAFNRDATAEFAQFAEQYGIKPVIAKEFAFGDVVAAFEALQNQSEVGKIVVRLSDE